MESLNLFYNKKSGYSECSKSISSTAKKVIDYKKEIL